MPNGDELKSELELKLSEWEKEAAGYGTQLEDTSGRIDILQTQLATLATPTTDVEELKEKYRIAETIPGYSPWVGIPSIKGQLAADIKALAIDITKLEFYTRLYTVIPIGIMGEAISSIDEALSAVAPPAGMTDAELSSVREIVRDMLGVAGIEAREAELEEGEISPEQPMLPALVKPVGREVGPTGVQKLTVDSIIQYLTAPRVPAPTLGDAEWDELLAKSYPEYADMTQVEIVQAEAQRIIAESKLANEQMSGFQSAIAEMPEYKLSDFFKELVMQPGLALLEVATIYFEKVSQPIAAGIYKWFIPDIESIYRRYRMAGEDTWDALQMAWEDWDAPGGDIGGFLLKYMFMENLTDPLTWLAVFTLGTSMIAGTTGRFTKFAVMLNKANRVIFAPFEMPFDFIKWVVGGRWTAETLKALHLPAAWAGRYVLPKTISQRAMIVEGATGRVVKEFMERFAGKGKLLNKGLTMADWDKLAKRSIKYAFDNPQSTDVIAETGRVLLKHKPILGDDLIRYAKRLGITIAEPDITPGMLADVNTIFEAMFQKYGSKAGKLMTSKEAGKRFLKVLGLAGGDDATYKKAVAILERRAKNIVAEAYAFSEAVSPGKALQHLMKRNFDYHIELEKASKTLLISQSGRFNQLYSGIEAKFVGIWQKYVEEIAIRPLAQSYLTFAMYGPMNVIEDHWRSILGGVYPRKMDVGRMAHLSRGLSIDPDLINPSLGMSESIGRLTRRGGDEQWNNWILQLAMLGQKDWADKLYTGLVRLPGGFGMDIRRNFVGQKYLVLLKEMGGETAEVILRTEASVPRLLDKKLVRALRDAVYDAKTTLDVDSIRAVKDTFTRKSIYRKEVQSIIKEHPDLPNVVRDFILQSFDDNTLYTRGVRTVNSRMAEANTKLMDDYLKGGSHATKQFQELTNTLVEMEVRNPEEMAHLLYNVNIASDIYGKAPEEILAQATIASQGKSLPLRRAHFDQIYDDILDFRIKAGGNMEDLVEKLRVDLRAGKTFNSEYTTKSERLLDLLIAKKSLSDQFRLEDMAWRQELFSGVDAKKMTDEWWQSTYRAMRQRINTHKGKMVGIEGDIFSALKSVDIAGGVVPFSRQPIKIVGRALAPQDIASLVGCQGDDLSRALLDNLTIVNDRDMFVEYIMRQLRPGDEGFTREAVGDVFDQIARQARLKPEAISWVTSKQMEMEAVRGDLHHLYHSKLLPDDEVLEISRYVNETASMMDDLAYEPIAKAVDVRLHEPIADTDIYGLMAKHNLEATPYVLPGVTTRSQPLSVAYNSYIIGDPKDFHAVVKSMADSVPFQRDLRRKLADAGLPDEFVVYRGRMKGAELAEDYTNVTLDKKVAEVMSVFHGQGVKPEDWIVDRFIVNRRNIIGMGRTTETELFIKTGDLNRRVTVALKPKFQELNTIRQTAMDEAHKWYYKEFTDYSNANAFDQIMKGIFPFWGYESQRWFWMPRSFVRHPGTFTAFERWQDNTDYGYIPVSGTSIEINPFRGTIYGPLTTRLSRRDYPEYYDAWEAAEPITEYFDWLSRYGFYLGGHFSIPMSLFGGLEIQVGEALPPVWESPLMVLQGIAPESKAVKVLTDHIFSDRFRTYMTIQEVISRGGDGVTISAKLQRNEPLTEEEQAMWDDARGPAAGYSLLFENTGLFRLRHPEKREVYKAATDYITKKYGYTEDQQKWLRMHGHRIWDQIGGMSLEDQRILEELEYFRYTGTIDRLLPGRQQLVLDKLTLAWDKVEKFVDLTIERKEQLENDFQLGLRGPDDYQNQLKTLYSEQQDFIYNEMRDNLDEPLPEGLSADDERAFIREHSVMELEGRKRYYEKWGIPLPVMHPLKELLNLYYSIELNEVRDPETGELVRDWDTFWAQRLALEEAIPDMWKDEFKTYTTKNETPMEAIRRKVYQTYFTKYWWVWDQVLKGYNETEQKLIREYISLENRGMDLPRQAQIKATKSEKTGTMLISGFRSDISEARQALRYANPTLDAWLFYWGRVGSFQTSQAEEIYYVISKETGRKIH